MNRPLEISSPFPSNHRLSPLHRQHPTTSYHQFSHRPIPPPPRGFHNRHPVQQIPVFRAPQSPPYHQHHLNGSHPLPYVVSHPPVPNEFEYQSQYDDSHQRQSFPPEPFNESVKIPYTDESFIETQRPSYFESTASPLYIEQLPREPHTLFKTSRLRAFPSSHATTTHQTRPTPSPHPYVPGRPTILPKPPPSILPSNSLQNKSDEGSLSHSRKGVSGQTMSCSPENLYRASVIDRNIDEEIPTQLIPMTAVATATVHTTTSMPLSVSRMVQQQQSMHTEGDQEDFISVEKDNLQAASLGAVSKLNSSSETCGMSRSIAASIELLSSMRRHEQKDFLYPRHAVQHSVSNVIQHENTTWVDVQSEASPIRSGEKKLLEPIAGSQDDDGDSILDNRSLTISAIDPGAQVHSHHDGYNFMCKGSDKQTEEGEIDDEMGRIYVGNKSTREATETLPNATDSETNTRQRQLCQSREPLLLQVIPPSFVGSTVGNSEPPASVQPRLQKSARFSRQQLSSSAEAVDEDNEGDQRQGNNTTDVGCNDEDGAVSSISDDDEDIEDDNAKNDRQSSTISPSQLRRQMLIRNPIPSVVREFWNGKFNLRNDQNSYILSARLSSLDLSPNSTMLSELIDQFLPFFRYIVLPQQQLSIPMPLPCELYLMSSQIQASSFRKLMIGFTNVDIQPVALQLANNPSLGFEGFTFIAHLIDCSKIPFRWISLNKTGVTSNALHCIFQAVLNHRRDGIYPRRVVADNPHQTIPLWLDLNEAELNFDPDKDVLDYLDTIEPALFCRALNKFECRINRCSSPGVLFHLPKLPSTREEESIQRGILHKDSTSSNNLSPVPRTDSSVDTALHIGPVLRFSNRPLLSCISTKSYGDEDERLSCVSSSLSSDHSYQSDDDVMSAIDSEEEEEEEEEQQKEPEEYKNQKGLSLKIRRTTPYWNGETPHGGAEEAPLQTYQSHTPSIMYQQRRESGPSYRSQHGHDLTQKNSVYCSNLPISSHHGSLTSPNSPPPPPPPTFPIIIAPPQFATPSTSTSHNMTSYYVPASINTYDSQIPIPDNRSHSNTSTVGESYRSRYKPPPIHSAGQDTLTGSRNAGVADGVPIQKEGQPKQYSTIFQKGYPVTIPPPPPPPDQNGNLTECSSEHNLQKRSIFPLADTQPVSSSSAAFSNEPSTMAPPVLGLVYRQLLYDAYLSLAQVAVEQMIFPVEFLRDLFELYVNGRPPRHLPDVWEASTLSSLASTLLSKPLSGSFALQQYSKPVSGRSVESVDQPDGRVPNNVASGYEQLVTTAVAKQANGSKHLREADDAIINRVHGDDEDDRMEGSSGESGLISSSEESDQGDRVSLTTQNLRPKRKWQRLVTASKAPVETDSRSGNKSPASRPTKRLRLSSKTPKQDNYRSRPFLHAESTCSLSPVASEDCLPIPSSKPQVVNLLDSSTRQSREPSESALDSSSSHSSRYYSYNAAVVGSSSCERHGIQPDSDGSSSCDDQQPLTSIQHRYYENDVLAENNTAGTKFEQLSSRSSPDSVQMVREAESEDDSLEVIDPQEIQSINFPHQRRVKKRPKSSRKSRETLTVHSSKGTTQESSTSSATCHPTILGLKVGEQPPRVTGVGDGEGSSGEEGEIESFGGSGSTISQRCERNTKDSLSKSVVSCRRKNKSVNPSSSRSNICK